MKADLDNAANLLGVNRISGGGDDELSKIRNAKPVSKEDWEALASQAYEAAIKPQSSRAGYEKYFGPHLITLICRDMRDVDMRLMSTRLKDMAEKKTKAEKEAKKNGGVLKKPKPKNTSTASAKNTVDTTNCESLQSFYPRLKSLTSCASLQRRRRERGGRPRLHVALFGALDGA